MKRCIECGDTNGNKKLQFHGATCENCWDGVEEADVPQPPICDYVPKFIFPGILLEAIPDRVCVCGDKLPSHRSKFCHKCKPNHFKTEKKCRRCDSLIKRGVFCNECRINVGRLICRVCGGKEGEFRKNKFGNFLNMHVGCNRKKVVKRPKKKKLYVYEPPERKACSKCKEEKHISQFHVNKQKNGQYRPYYHCKKCHSVMVLNYKFSHLDKVRQYHKIYNKTHKRKGPGEARKINTLLPSINLNGGE